MRASLSPLLQLLLAAPLVSGHRWFNWQFDLTCEATTYFVPDDEADLANFVKNHHEAQSMIKVVGNGHAFGNMTTCVDVHATNRSSHIVSLTNLKELEVHEDNTVTFQAGWDLYDLIPELKRRGISMYNLGSERVQNFLGVITTGTHGTGRNLGNLASEVIGFRVMDSSGDITIVNQTHNADLLPAFRISLGALGIITEVTVQAQPLKYLKRTSQVFNSSENFEEMYSSIHDLYEKYDRVQVDGPHMTWNDTTSNWTMESELTATWFEDTDITDINNCTDYCSNACGPCERNLVCYGELSDAVSTPPAGVCQRFFMAQFEHFLPVENYVDALSDYTTQQLNEAPKELPYDNYEMVYETRFVKADDTWMSPVNKYNLDNSSSGVFAVIEMSWWLSYNNFTTLWAYQDLASEYLPKFGMEYNVRPHWGKMSWFNETYAEFIYPHLDDFLAIQEKMDPNCQFVNDFLVEHLGIHRCAYAFDNALVPNIMTSLKH